eukprot:gene9476-32468_t
MTVVADVAEDVQEVVDLQDLQDVQELVDVQDVHETIVIVDIAEDVQAMQDVQEVADAQDVQEVADADTTSSKRKDPPTDSHEADNAETKASQGSEAGELIVSMTGHEPEADEDGIKGGEAKRHKATPTSDAPITDEQEQDFSFKTPGGTGGGKSNEGGLVSGAPKTGEGSYAGTPVGVLLVEGQEITHEAQLQKLMRMPRYFDYGIDFVPEVCIGRFNCGLVGHTAQYFDDGIDNFAPEARMRCFNCGMVGHAARECTNAARQKPCTLCARLGHEGRDCPNRLCFKCGELGHMSRDCTGSDGRGVAGCLRCGQINCAASGKGDYFRYEGACDTAYLVTDLSRCKCYVCGNYGHLCCKVTPENNSGGGGGGHNRGMGLPMHQDPGSMHRQHSAPNLMGMSPVPGGGYNSNAVGGPGTPNSGQYTPPPRYPNSAGRMQQSIGTPGSTGGGGGFHSPVPAGGPGGVHAHRPMSAGAPPYGGGHQGGSAYGTSAHEGSAYGGSTTDRYGNAGLRASAGHYSTGGAHQPSSGGAGHYSTGGAHQPISGGAGHYSAGGGHQPSNGGQYPTGGGHQPSSIGHYSSGGGQQPPSAGHYSSSTTITTAQTITTRTTKAITTKSITITISKAITTASQPIICETLSKISTGHDKTRWLSNISLTSSMVVQGSTGAPVVEGSTGAPVTRLRLSPVESKAVTMEARALQAQHNRAAGSPVFNPTYGKYGTYPTKVDNMIRWLRDMWTRSRSTFIGLMIGGVLSTIAALLAIAAFVSPELSNVTTLAVALATTMVSVTQVALSYREFVSRNPAPSGSTDVQDDCNFP